MPGVIRLLPIPKPSAGFYDFEEYERLIEAAKLLGGWIADVSGYREAPR
jgi:hypothetical protein